MKIPESNRELRKNVNGHAERWFQGEKRGKCRFPWEKAVQNGAALRTVPSAGARQRSWAGPTPAPNSGRKSLLDRDGRGGAVLVWRMGTGECAHARFIPPVFAVRRRRRSSVSGKHSLGRGPVSRGVTMLPMISFRIPRRGALTLKKGDDTIDPWKKRGKGGEWGNERESRRSGMRAEGI